MPLVDIEPIPLGQGIDRPEGFAVTPPEEKFHGTFGDVVGSTFRRENLLVSGNQAAKGVDDTDDPTFKPFEEIKGTKYEPHWNSFVDVRNRAQFNEAARRIDQENEDRKIIDAAPWWMTVPASLMANVTDPTIAVPGGTFVRGAKGGFSVLKSAASVGAAAGVGTALQETGLLSQQ